MSAPSPARSRREAGETLIELLISMVVIGIMGAAVVGAVMMAVNVSLLHRNEVRVQQVLRSWAEVVSNTDDATFTSCGTAACLEALAPSVSGVSVSAGTPECWAWTASGYDTTATSSCTSTSSLRRVTLTVSASGVGMVGASQQLTVTMRRPCSGTSAC